jgi:hypothetical protein
VESARHLAVLVEARVLRVVRLGTDYSVRFEHDGVRFDWACSGAQQQATTCGTHDLLIEALGQLPRVDGDPSPLTANLLQNGLIQRHNNGIVKLDQHTLQLVNDSGALLFACNIPMTYGLSDLNDGLLSMPDAARAIVCRLVSLLRGSILLPSRL